MTGRFAPSPTGELHRGSLVAAMASYLDAKSAHRSWLVRIEDVDKPRTVPGAARGILETLAQLGLHSDAPVLYQSERGSFYAAAFAKLQAHRQVFGCRCSRRELGELGSERYPGTCRLLNLANQPAPPALAWRVCLPSSPITWTDRWLGPQRDDLAQISGEYVVRRKDHLWAYQLAVVVDDAQQGVTSVVRGADLLDSTARQLHLQNLLGLDRPRYLHVPVVLAADGLKLSKQNGARPVAAAWIGASDPLSAKTNVLNEALMFLGFSAIHEVRDLQDYWARACAQWAQRWQV